uniref:Putative ovule protein n=1 Tax=Solanum chacoense TaxID=4108 RepID=A0A0V0GPT4_SOLCH
MKPHNPTFFNQSRALPFTSGLLDEHLTASLLVLHLSVLPTFTNEESRELIVLYSFFWKKGERR